VQTHHSVRVIDNGIDCVALPMVILQERN